MACAIGLLTRLEMCPDVSRADVLGDQPLGEVLAGMEVVAAALLTSLYPSDGGARMLQGLGLVVAERAAGNLTGGPQ
jgi:hypothetical protein